MRGAPGTDYARVDANDLQVGDIVIVEHIRFDYDTGRPVESVYYRAIVGEHMTVGGMMFHLINEPDLSFPNIATWSCGYIYAGNSGTCQMWKREKYPKPSH